MTARGIRTARGTAVAGFAVFVAALFHDAAGGGLPSAVGVVLALAFAVPLCIVLAGRRIALWRQVTSVALSQLLLHLMFGLGSSETGTVLQAPAGHAGMVHADAHVQLTGGDAMAMGHDNAWMYLAHATAALVTIVALRHGERTLHALAEFTVLLVTAITRIRAVPLVAPAGMPVQSRPLTLAAPRRVLGALRHRGPPTIAVA
jgi:hypothetical protein